MTKQHGVYSEVNRKTNMAYKDFLKEKIKELEQKIASSEEEKKEVQAELNKLRLAEFEEDMATESNQQLLKG
jgi:chloramphenicol O-acetyltransferase